MKPVLLLPGPASVQAAQGLFGDVYEYQSYLNEDYISDTVAFAANGHLQPLAGRHIDVWPIPPRRRPIALGAESIIRQLLKLKCTVRVIAIGDEDEQYEPRACELLGMSRDQVLAWARARIKTVEVPPPESEVPRETKPVRRGKPRSRPDGSPVAGGTEITSGEVSPYVLWQSLGLDCNSNGTPYTHIANVQRILAGYSEIADRLWFDEFHGRIFTTLFSDTPQEWNDNFDTRLCGELITRFRLPRLAINIVQRAVTAHASVNVRNEVREWADSLVWDGTERLWCTFHDAFGTPADDYHAGIGRCWFVSMAARIYQPGCKVDYMPVFEGVQGKSKTQALEIIGGRWFAELHEDVNKKDFFLALQGKLLVEFTELHQFTRADIDRIKGIITCRVDRYRSPFERHTADHPRQCVFAGTTNRDDWVTDDTGARRFWPVACQEINLDYLRANRDQLFAEAIRKYNSCPSNATPEQRMRAGAAWWDIDFSLAEEQQDARREIDPWFEPVADWVAGRDRISTTDVLEFAIALPVQKHDMSTMKRVGSILRMLGFKRRVIKDERKNKRLWIRTGSTGSGDLFATD